MHRFGRSCWIVCVVGLVLAGGRPLLASEIQWRNDFASAQREAVEKKRPLFMDVVTSSCLFCVKLDASTFRDPALIQMLNDRFIPVKVDGERNTIMLQGKVVSSFPTLAFLAPDSNVLGIQEGFVEAPGLQEKALKVLAALAPAAAPRTSAPSAQTAAPAPVQPPSQASPPAQAAAPKPPPPFVPRRTIPPLQGDVRVGSMETLSTVWPAPREPRFSSTHQFVQPVEERVFRARHLLHLAQEDYQRQQWVACLEHCKALALLYPDLPEGIEARQLAIRIRTNPDLLERLGRDLSESLAEVYWDLAHSKLRQNQAAQAVPYLDRIVQTCPGTRYAPAAQEYLLRLAGNAAATKK